MLQYSARRVLEAIPTILGVLILTFLLVHMTPGNPALIMLGSHYSPEKYQHLVAQLGLNKPLPVQFVLWLWQVLHGNLGMSYEYNQPVWLLIMQALPHTLTIVGLGTLFAFVISIIQGVYQASVANSPQDLGITGVAYFLYSMPSFWLAILLIVWFSFDIPLFPPGGITDPGISNTSFGVWASHLFLPVITLTLITVAYAGRFMRQSMVNALVEDYIRTAHAKGVKPVTVLLKHAFRNSLIPLITLFGFSIPGLFAGALIIEEVFNYPGLGLLFWTAAGARDYPVILGITAIIGVLTVLGNLIADLLYGFVDPRISYD